MKIRVRVLSLVLIMLFIGCSNSKIDKKKGLVFAPDSTLIQASHNIDSTSFSYNPPSDYKSLIEDIKEAQNKSELVVVDNEELREQLINVYGNMEKRNLCFVSLYDFKKDITLSAVKDIFLTGKDSTKIKTGTFKNNGLDFNQARVLNDNGSVQFIVWTKAGTNQFLKFDYVINNREDFSGIKAVGSSISTIKNSKKGVMK